MDMRKNMMALGAAALALACWQPARAEITVNVPEGTDSVAVAVETVDLMLGVDNPAVGKKDYKLPVAGGKVVVETILKPAAYHIALSDTLSANLFASPDDSLTVTFPAGEGQPTVTGSELMDELEALETMMAPQMDKVQQAMAAGNDMRAYQEYNQLMQMYYQYALANPASEGAVYAVMVMGDPSLQVGVFDALAPEARQSILYPLAQASAEKARKALEREQAMEAMKGKPAPDFSLPNMEGKQMSLADFKGKYVILDFWGSWCKWCIKGFPELKKAYAEYAGQLEIVGIDCRDSEEQWRAAVARYELPWVQLFNGNDTAVTSAYNVQGFPTKVIVDPQGTLVDVVVGEDPAFFDTLESLLKK